jgi:hypothetical protein
MADYILGFDVAPPKTVYIGDTSTSLKENILTFTFSKKNNPNTATNQNSSNTALPNATPAIYLSNNWGDTNESLCTLSEASSNKFTCDNKDWSVSWDELNERYKIKPSSTAVTEEFSFSVCCYNFITTANAGSAIITAEFVNFTGIINEKISVTVTKIYPVEIKKFTADINPANIGQVINLSWDTYGANYCSLNGGIGEVETIGGTEVTITKPFVYTLTAEDSLGRSVSSELQININPPEIVSFLPKEVQYFYPGEKLKYSWEINSAESVSIDYEKEKLKDLLLIGCAEIEPEESGYCRLEAVGYNGTSAYSVDKTVKYEKTGWQNMGAFTPPVADFLPTAQNNRIFKFKSDKNLFYLFSGGKIYESAGLTSWKEVASFPESFFENEEDLSKATVILFKEELYIIGVQSESNHYYYTYNINEKIFSDKALIKTGGVACYSSTIINGELNFIFKTGNSVYFYRYRDCRYWEAYCVLDISFDAEAVDFISKGSKIYLALKTDGKVKILISDTKNIAFSEGFELECPGWFSLVTTKNIPYLNTEKGIYRCDMWTKADPIALPTSKQPWLYNENEFVQLIQNGDKNFIYGFKQLEEKIL